MYLNNIFNTTIKLKTLMVSVVLIYIILLILWMNVTPGHFQPECKVGYYTNEEVYDYFNYFRPVDECGFRLPSSKWNRLAESIQGFILIKLSLLDFYK